MWVSGNAGTDLWRTRRNSDAGPEAMAWIGEDFIRWYRFEGPNLLISLNPDFENSLLWERLPDG